MPRSTSAASARDAVDLIQYHSATSFTCTPSYIRLTASTTGTSRTSKKTTTPTIKQR